MSEQVGALVPVEIAEAIALAMYANCVCQICGHPIRKDEESVWAEQKPENLNRIAHKSCWENQKRDRPSIDY